ncbi:MAG: twin-arginine translocase TatA/TatE family subunit [Bdellovibrionaceae bacterium]|nr:twin-arginine translocase TatA/TatE family subunit [Pseudobdellovibrionaceae bacterium]
MFGLSTGHLLILLVVALLLFGSRRLPELGESLGKGLRAFKKGIEGGSDEPKQIDQEKKSPHDPDHKA